MDVISWLPPHCTQVPWAIFIWERNEQTSGVSWFWQVAFWKPCSAFLATIAQAGLSRVESLDFGWYFELFGAQGHCQHGGLRLCTRWSCDWRQWSREAFWCGWVCMWLWQLDQGLDQWGFHLLCLGYYPFKWPQLSLLTWPSFVDSSTQQLQSESFALVGHQVQLICEHLCVCEQKITGEFLLWWHISWLCGGREPLLMITALLMCLSCALGHYVALEQPMTSCMPLHPIMSSVISYFSCHRTVTYLGAFGSSTVKPVQLMSTLSLDAVVREKPRNMSESLATRGPHDQYTGKKDQLVESEVYPVMFGRAVAAAFAANRH